MLRNSVPIKTQSRDSVYDVSIGDDLIANAGPWAARCLTRKAGRILIVSNRKVFGLYGAAVATSLSGTGFDICLKLIGDGERFKNFRTLETVLNALSGNKFTRTDSIIALGGGVVGDLAGFAAAVYLRGIEFLQIPTTVLSMIDSSVGGKTAVNTAFGKNLVGSFYQPRGVLIDTRSLRTLPRRELTAGMCEAVKQGAISGKPLLRQTAAFLNDYPVSGFRSHFADPLFSEALAELLSAQVSFKAKIVQNDEKEAASNTSSRSRKILNFGHTFAHALEKVTDYKYLKHGEAVGYGIRFATILSKKLALLRQDEVDLLNDVVRRAGALPAISHIDPSKILEAFQYDKKQVDASLHWILLRGIGKPVIVPDTDIPKSAIASTLNTVLQKS